MIKDVARRLYQLLHDEYRVCSSGQWPDLSLLTNSDVTDNVPEINIIEHRQTPLHSDYGILSFVIFEFEERFFKLEYELNSAEDMSFPDGRFKEVFPIKKTITEYV